MQCTNILFILLQQALTLAVSQPMQVVNPVSGTQNLHLVEVTQMAGRKSFNQPVKVGQPDANFTDDKNEQHLRRVQ